jgi:hypothetical protein
MAATDLLKDDEIRRLVMEIVEGFVTECKGIEPHVLKTKLGPRWKLHDELLTSHILKQFGDRLYPGLPAFEIADKDAELSARNCVDAVVNGLRSLYGSKGPDSYHFPEIVRACNLDVTSPSDVRRVKIGLVLATELPCVSGSSGDGSFPVYSINVTDAILDFLPNDSAWDRAVRGRSGQLAPPTNVTIRVSADSPPKPPEPTRDFTNYSLSPRVNRILDEARRWLDTKNVLLVRVSSSRLLFAIADLGLDSGPLNAARFLNRWFATNAPEAYEEARTIYGQNHPYAASQPAGAAGATTNTYAIFERAREIAKETNRTETIHTRHLLGALLTCRAPDGGPAARGRIRGMGVQIEIIQRDFRAHLRQNENTDNQIAWDSILQLSPSPGAQSDGESTRALEDSTPKSGGTMPRRNRAEPASEIVGDSSHKNAGDTSGNANLPTVDDTSPSHGSGSSNDAHIVVEGTALRTSAYDDGIREAERDRPDSIYVSNVSDSPRIPWGLSLMWMPSPSFFVVKIRSPH